MPPQGARRRHIPPLLRLDGKQQSAGDETRPACHLRYPEHAVLDASAQVVDDAREAREAAYPEDGGADELDEGGLEADLADVVRAELGESREPGEGAGAGSVSVAVAVSGGLFV